MTSDIDRGDRKRSIAQSSLDNRNRVRYSKPREQPQEHPKIQKAIQFGQLPHKSLINLDGDNE